MTGDPREQIDPDLLAELNRRADEAVANFPALTGEQLIEIRRLFGPAAQPPDKLPTKAAKHRE